MHSERLRVIKPSRKVWDETSEKPGRGRTSASIVLKAKPGGDSCSKGIDILHMQRQFLPPLPFIQNPLPFRRQPTPPRSGRRSYS